MPALEVAREYDPRPPLQHRVPVDVAERPVVIALEREHRDAAWGIYGMVAGIVGRRVQHTDVEHAVLAVLVTGGNILRHGPVREGVAMQGDTEIRQIERLAGP